MNYFLVHPTHFSWKEKDVKNPIPWRYWSNCQKMNQNKSACAEFVPKYCTRVPILIHYYTSLRHYPIMLSFAWWFCFYFEHNLPPSLFCNFCLNCSYCLFYPFIIFFISPIFLFFCFSPLPSPLPRPRPPSFLSFQPHQSPQPPLKTLSAAAPAPPPCW